jgi:23S rRNA pseudouridine2605 synthase
VTTIRLSRFLARAGASSRRGAAELVEAGRVRINGEPPKGPGDPIDPERDTVTLDGRTLALPQDAWLALHKPAGVVTSRQATERHPSVFGLLAGVPDSLVVVGRLDVMSEGLLLFTTDGELAARLMHPKWEVPRAYRVYVTGAPDAKARAALDKGVMLPDESRPVKARRWRFVPDARGGALDLELAEGRSRVVRRLCAQLGLGVRTLTRIGYGPIELGSLKPGAARPLTGHERDVLYRSVQLEPPRD